MRIPPPSPPLVESQTDQRGGRDSVTKNVQSAKFTSGGEAKDERKRT